MIYVAGIGQGQEFQSTPRIKEVRRHRGPVSYVKGKLVTPRGYGI